MFPRKGVTQITGDGRGEDLRKALGIDTCIQSIFLAYGKRNPHVSSLVLRCPSTDIIGGSLWNCN